MLSVNTTEHATLSGHEDTKEEEVYQDLCSIQNVARNQVFYFLFYLFFHEFNFSNDLFLL